MAVFERTIGSGKVNLSHTVKGNVASAAWNEVTEWVVCVPDLCSGVCVSVVFVICLGCLHWSETWEALFVLTRVLASNTSVSSPLQVITHVSTNPSGELLCVALSSHQLALVPASDLLVTAGDADGGGGGGGTDGQASLGRIYGGLGMVA